MIAHLFALCIDQAAARYHVPRAMIRQEISLASKSEAPGIGVMKIPSAWTPVLAQNGLLDLQSPCPNIMAGTFIMAVERRPQTQSTPIQQAVFMASREYHVPVAQIERVLKAPRSPKMIGPMGIPPAWIPLLENAGFSSVLVRSSPVVGIFAGTWALAVERMGHSIDVNAGPSPTPPAWFMNIAGKYAAQYKVPLALVAAVAAEESGFHPAAVSDAGAIGTMQLMPQTAAHFGVRNIWNVQQNIRGGVAYLAYLSHQLNGNLPLILAGYNAGAHAVIQYGFNIPPFAQTEAYVPQVISRYKFYQKTLPEAHS